MTFFLDLAALVARAVTVTGTVVNTGPGPSVGSLFKPGVLSLVPQAYQPYLKEKSLRGG